MLPPVSRSVVRQAGALVAAAVGLAVATPAAAHPHGAAECSMALDIDAARLTGIDLRLRLDEAMSRILAERLQLRSAEPDATALGARGLMAAHFRKTGWMTAVRPGADPAVEPVPLADVAPATWSLAEDGRVWMAVRLQPEVAESASMPGGSAGWQGTVSCVDPEWYWQGLFDAQSPMQVRGARCRFEAQGTPAPVPRAPTLSFASPPTMLTDRPPAVVTPAVMRVDCGA